MFATPEHISAFNASTLDAALQLSRISIDATERMFSAGIEAGREVSNEAAKVSALNGETKTFQDFIATQSKTAEAGVEKAMALSKSFYDVAQHAQKEFASVMEVKVSEFNRVLNTSLDQALKSAPAGADAAVAAIKSTVAASAAAFESISKAARQTASAAEANVQAVVESATPRAKGAKR
jgi:phasin family protein